MELSFVPSIVLNTNCGGGCQLLPNNSPSPSLARGPTFNGHIAPKLKHYLLGSLTGVAI